MIKNPLVATPLKFGLLGGSMTILMFMITYWMDKHPLIDMKFFDFIIIPIFIFFSLKEFRDFQNGGILHFWQGMTLGVINYLLVAVISALFILVFLNLIDPILIDSYINDRLGIIDLKKEDLISQMGEETYQKSREDTLNITAGILALDDFLKKCLIGLTLTIPMSVLLRRRAL